MQMDKILSNPAELFQGPLGDITIYYRRKETKCLNVDEALMLSRDYDHISYTEWPNGPTLTCKCSRLVSLFRGIPYNLIRIIVSYIVYPEIHTVLGEPYPFWSSDALTTLFPRFTVLDATIHVPLHIFQRYGLQVYRQNANIFDLIDDPETSVYRSQSVRDATWGRGSYYKASETVVILS